MKIKRLISTLIVVAMMLTMGISNIVFASNQNGNNGNNFPALKNQFQSITQTWIDQNYTFKAKVDEVIPVVNGYEELIGVLITYKFKGDPCGYLVLSLIETDDNPVVAFSLEGEDIFTSMSRVGGYTNNSSKIKKLYSETMTSFSIETANGKGILKSNGVIEDKDEFIKNSKAMADRVKELYPDVVEKIDTATQIFYGKSTKLIYDAFSGVPSGTIQSQGNLTGATTFTPVLMKDMPAYNDYTKTAGSQNEGNCGPTALTNVIKYYHEKRGKTGLLRYGDLRIYTYGRLSFLSGYHPDIGMNTSVVISTLTTYASEQGFTCSGGAYWLNLWSDFTRDINADKAIVLFVKGKIDDKDSNGHFVVVLGYRQHTNNAQFLRVADGWYASNNRFVKFKPVELTSFRGFCVPIT